MKNTLPRMGWLCSFVPEEIAMSAGLLPIRVSGDTEGIGVADGYIYPNLCPYVKSVLALGVGGKAKHLDGLVFVRSCDGMRRMYDAWRSYVDMRFVYMLEVPKNRDEAAVEYFAGQLRKFARALEQEFGNEITQASLRGMIRTVNESRKLMQHIYSLQRKIPLPLPGSEVFQLGLEGMEIDKKAFITKLEKYYNEAKSQKAGGKGDNRARILISGSVVDHPELFHLIEAVGADIAAADICTAMRHFDHLVDEEDDDPYLTLARRYLGKLQCARTVDIAGRVAELKQLIRDYTIDGVVYTSVKFCDQHLYDVPYLIEVLKDEKVPVLFLENDYSWGGIEQLTTRVETFVEMLNRGRK